MKRALKGLILIAAALLVMFSTSSYASGTCAVKGCYKSAVLGGSYCKNHTCSKSGCKNFSADGSYCSEHQKKTYGKSGKSAPSSSGSSSSKTCAISGCRKSITGGSAYCYQHKCKHAGCKNYGSENGYCSKHRSKAYDPYDVYDYNDPEDFYYDWEDDFEDYEDAEEYWDDAWN